MNLMICQKGIALSVSVSLFLAGNIALATPVGSTRAPSAGPPAGYKIDPEHTTRSPDGATTIEQYVKINGDGDSTWQFWVRRAGKMTMLEPEQPGYPGLFHFSKDSRWMVRMQKTSPLDGSVYLYRLGPREFGAATSKPLSDLAWEYFRSHPDSKEIGIPNDPVWAGIRCCFEEDSRYLFIYLAGQVAPTARHDRRALNQWDCRYDLQNGTFDVLPEDAEGNAAAIAPDASFEMFRKVMPAKSAAGPSH